MRTLRWTRVAVAVALFCVMLIPCVVPPNTYELTQRLESMQLEHEAMLLALEKSAASVLRVSKYIERSRHFAIRAHEWVSLMQNTTNNTLLLPPSIDYEGLFDSDATTGKQVFRGAVDVQKERLREEGAPLPIAMVSNEPHPGLVPQHDISNTLHAQDMRIGGRLYVNRKTKHGALLYQRAGEIVMREMRHDAWTRFNFTIVNEQRLKVNKSASPLMDEAHYRVRDDTMEVRYTYAHDTPGQSDAASHSVYRFSLPTFRQTRCHVRHPYAYRTPEQHIGAVRVGTGTVDAIDDDKLSYSSYEVNMLLSRTLDNVNHDYVYASRNNVFRSEDLIGHKTGGMYTTRLVYDFEMRLHVHCPGWHGTV